MGASHLWDISEIDLFELGFGPEVRWGVFEEESVSSLELLWGWGDGFPAVGVTGYAGGDYVGYFETGLFLAGFFGGGFFIGLLGGVVWSLAGGFVEVLVWGAVVGGFGWGPGGA